jgi:hypothetical protein
MPILRSFLSSMIGAVQIKAPQGAPAGGFQLNPGGADAADPVCTREG